MELIGFAISFVLAYWFYPYFGRSVAEHTGLVEQAANAIAFLILWFAFQVIYSLILRFTYPRIPSRFRAAVPNRLAGLLPAFAKGFVIISIILTVLVWMPVPDKLKSEVDNSFFGSRFVKNSSAVEHYLTTILGGDLKNSLTFITVPPQTEQIINPDERVDLKFKTTEVTVDTASEQKMLSLVNEERAKQGLKQLVWDEELAKVARKHSADMFARGYFAHENPDGLSPFDRMEQAGVKFQVAGENIAYAPNVDLAHNGLMRSPGHRANIMGADYGRLGIGVIDGGIYGKMFTQNFRD